MDSQSFLKECRPELQGYLEDMVKFCSKVDTREVLRDLSAMSARASLMRNVIIRSSSNDLTRFRIDEIDPFLFECDRQFKIYSRLISAEKLEYDLTSQ